MSDEPRDPGLSDVLALVLEHARDNAGSMFPARIEAYDADKQSASIQILVKTSHIDEEGARKSIAIGQLHDVPVWQFGGATGRITVPVIRGDVGMAIVSSLAIGRWKLIGGIVDPGDYRRNNINDCFFVPGGHDFAHVPTTAPTDAIVTHGDTRLGGPDADDDENRVVIEDTLNQLMDVLSTVTDPSGACAALHAALEGIDWPGAFTARKVKAK